MTIQQILKVADAHGIVIKEYWDIYIITGGYISEEECKEIFNRLKGSAQFTRYKRENK